MINFFTWHITIVGALVCLATCWFLSSVSNHQNVRFGIIGKILGILGAAVLSTMAFAGPFYSSELHIIKTTEREKMTQEIETDPVLVEAKALNNSARILAERTLRAAGKRPGKSYLAYKYGDGTYAWVTKEEYLKLKRGEK